LSQSALSLEDSDLPPIFHVADMSSVAAQRLFVRSAAVRLISLVAAGVFGLFVWKVDGKVTDWAGVLAVVSFVTALIIETYLLRTRPDRTWYEARAAAESVKTLSWRYSVGGEPFEIGTHAESEMDELFLDQLKAVINVLKELRMSQPASANSQITKAMRRARLASLYERKRLYEDSRIERQQQWYHDKAKWNTGRAALWTILMLIVEVGGIVGGVMKAVGIITGDILVFAGSVVAAMTAWLQTKQHQTLSTAYTVTGIELASVRSKIHLQEDESSWAKFVQDAEEAVSREHTLWKASRGAQSLE
jgi:SMODS and SLOG-associating 2TM effector domain 3/SMODS and SLOG-associating 2TM effector domain 1